MSKYLEIVPGMKIAAQISPEPSADLVQITTGGPGDIWITANRKDPASGATHALILYSDGSTWKTTALPESEPKGFSPGLSQNNPASGSQLFFRF